LLAARALLAPPQHKRAIAIAPQPARHTPQTFAYDAWGADDAALVDIYTSTGQLVNPRAPPRPEPSLARAVEVVAAGASYNPTYDAHQLLLQSALDSELERQAAKMRYAHAHAPRAVDELNQVGDGETAGADDDDDDDDEEEGAAGEGEDAAVVARRDARVAERKSKTERNRLARKRAHEVKETERLRSKELDKQLNRAAHIAKEIEAEVQAKAAAEAAKPMRPEQLLGVPKKLGKFKQRSEPWAALLTEELPSNLRTLPPTNNLLSDRFRSVHKRNLMEPRMKQTKKRKYALKEYTKKGFKEEDWQKL
jgi:nucleolar protein 53